MMEGHPNVLGDSTSQLALVCAYYHLDSVQLIVSKLRAIGGGTLSETAQQALLYTCLQTRLGLAFPNGPEYSRRLLQAVVVASEEDGCEVLDALMDLYMALLVGQEPRQQAQLPNLPSLPAPPAGWCYKLFPYAPSGQPAKATLECLAELGTLLTFPASSVQLSSACSPGRAACDCCCAGLLDQGDGSIGGGAASSGLGEGGSSGGKSGEAVQLPALVCGASCAGSEGLAIPACGLIALRVSHNLFEGGTGCHEWEAGFFLAEVVLSHPGYFTGRACLELGSGCGMVGVALHRARAAPITCTDGDAQSVYNCRLNLQLNGVPLRGHSITPAGPCGRLCFRQQPAAQVAAAGAGGLEAAEDGVGDRHEAVSWPAISCRELRWEEGAGGVGAEVVLGADILYDPDVIPTLLALIKELLGNGAQQQQQQQQQQADQLQELDAAGAAAAPRHVARAAAVPLSQATGRRREQRQPEALIATTLRNAATLARFVGTVQADEALLLEDVTAQLGLKGGIFGGGCQACAVPDSSSSQGREAGASVGTAVRFLHHTALEAARDRIVLHRLTLA